MSVLNKVRFYIVNFDFVHKSLEKNPLKNLYPRFDEEF